MCAIRKWICVLPAVLPFQISCLIRAPRRMSTGRQVVACTAPYSHHGGLAAKILGIGSCIPKSALSNDHIAEFLETSDAWISQRTGISSRRIITPDESLCDLATVAASNALQSANVDPVELDLVLLATSSPDDLFGDATTIAARIGAKTAVAFDLTAACSGFLFALVTGAQFLQAGTYETALVVGADVLSRWVNWADRSTSILFGDGAGAVVIRHATVGSILGFHLKSNGLDKENLRLAYSGQRQKLETSGNHFVAHGTYKPIVMNGREIYKFATREVPLILKCALQNAQLTVDDVDWLLLHQANIRIMETVAVRLGMSKEKIISTLAEHGNTSAGSIPLALDVAVKDKSVRSGDIIACAGFGAGLSWGAVIIRWDQQSG